MSRSLFLFFLLVPILLGLAFNARISLGGSCPNTEQPAHIVKQPYIYLAQVLHEEEIQDTDEPAKPADTTSENTGDEKDSEVAASPMIWIAFEPWHFDVEIPPGSKIISLATMDGGNGNKEDLAN